jgi:hypothetical protein
VKFTIKAASAFVDFAPEEPSEAAAAFLSPSRVEERAPASCDVIPRFRPLA